MDWQTIDLSKILEKCECGQRLSEEERAAWNKSVQFRWSILRKSLPESERQMFAQELDRELQEIRMKCQPDKSLSLEDAETLELNLLLRTFIPAKQPDESSTEAFLMLDQCRANLRRRLNDGEELSERESEFLSPYLQSLLMPDGEDLSKKELALVEESIEEGEVEERKRLAEAQDQSQQLWDKVAAMVNEAIKSKDKLVHCIVTPTGSGKTFAIKDAVRDHKHKAFTIFARSHRQLDQYQEAIEERGETCFHHRGIGGRKECPKELRTRFNQTFARGMKSVRHLCRVCEKLDSCGLPKLEFWDRFGPFEYQRIALAPHILFPLVSGGLRKWRRKGEKVDRIFVVDENYFDTLRLPRSYDHGQVLQFQTELRNFKNSGKEIPPEFEWLSTCINTVEVSDTKKGYVEIRAVNKDFRISKSNQDDWLEFFQQRNANGTVFNLLFEFESGVRNGVLVTNPHRKYPGEPRFYRFTFMVDTHKMPRLKNKLIITDATFRPGSKGELSAVLKVPEDQIRIHRSDEKSPNLVVWHHPFSNAPKSKAKKQLATVKKWIDLMVDCEITSSSDLLGGDIVRPKRDPSSVLIVSYRSYQAEGDEEREYGESIEESIVEHFRKRHSHIKPVFFHYGDESGYDVKEAQKCEKVLVVGKFQMPTDVIQALFLNSRKDLRCRANWEGNVNFEDEELQKEFDYYTFRASYQGASRARFFNPGGIHVHILSREDIVNTWKDVIDLEESYVLVDLRNIPELIEIFTRSKLLPHMVRVAEDILKEKWKCSRQDVLEALKGISGELPNGMTGSESTVRKQWENLSLCLSGIADSKKEKKPSEKNWTYWLVLKKNKEE